jgi:hypothetical protein
MQPASGDRGGGPATDRRTQLRRIYRRAVADRGRNSSTTFPHPPRLILPGGSRCLGCVVCAGIGKATAITRDHYAPLTEAHFAFRMRIPRQQPTR